MVRVQSEGAATGGLYRAAYHSIPSVATCDQRPDASELRDSSKSFSSQSSPTLGSGPGPLRTCQNRRKRWAGALARRLASPLLVFLSNTKNGVGMYRHDSEKPLMRALAPSCNIYNIDAAWRTVPGLASKSGAYRSWRDFHARPSSTSLGIPSALLKMTPGKLVSVFKFLMVGLPRSQSRAFLGAVSRTQRLVPRQAERTLRNAWPGGCGAGRAHVPWVNCTATLSRAPASGPASPGLSTTDVLPSSPVSDVLAHSKGGNAVNLTCEAHRCLETYQGATHVPMRSPRKVLPLLRV